MRNPFFAILGIFLLLLNACGRSYVDPNFGMKSMTETQAVEVLEDVPLVEERTLSGGSPTASAKGLEETLQELIDSGQIRVGGRQATSGSIDLSQLSNIFTLLKTGQVNSLLGLAQGLLAMNGGSNTATSKGLNTLLAVLQAAMPILLVVAPQFAPAVQALLTIIPIVLTFIGMFRKPKVQSAAYSVLVPMLA